MQIVEVTKDNFEQEVLGAKVPVVIFLGSVVRTMPDAVTDP